MSMLKRNRPAKELRETITALDTSDIRFPTSADARRVRRHEPRPGLLGGLPGIVTDADDGHEGHGFVFTIGRGNDVEVAAIDALDGHLLGRESSAALRHGCDLA